MDMDSYILFWVCIVGVCLGSFYNVVIIRSLSNESIVLPPSKCPKCNHKLSWWQNIPVLSYIILRGKCHFCKETISIQYPVVELITLILFGFSYLKYGISIQTLFVLFWASCFIIMTTTDLKAKLVDCNIAIASAIGGCIFNYLSGGWNGLLYSLAGLLTGIIIIEIIARLGYLFTQSRAMGEADTYVAGALGAIFGFPNILYVIVFSFIASMIFIVPVFLYNKFKSNDKKTLIMSILFVVSIVIYKSVVQSYFTLAGVIITGLLLAFATVKTMNKEENRSYLPFVPALSAGALYFLIIS